MNSNNKLNEENPENIKAGDIVMLKTREGAKMVVTNVGEAMYSNGLHAWCIWQEGSTHFEETIPIVALTKHLY